MCKCRALRERVAWLEKVINDAEWKLRYEDVFAEDAERHRSTQLVVAHDLANGRAGLPPHDYARRRASKGDRE